MTQYRTVWYTDFRQGSVDEPLIPAQEVDEGELYLHCDGKDGPLMRMWVRVTSGSGVPNWIRAYRGTPHPTLRNRFLGLTKNECPSWLKPATMTKYKYQASKMVCIFTPGTSQYLWGLW